MRQRATESRATYGLAADWRSEGGRWRTGASLSQAQISRTDAFNARLVSQFRVTERDALVLTVRGNKYRSLVDPEGDFDESTVSLQWSRRF